MNRHPRPPKACRCGRHTRAEVLRHDTAIEARLTQLRWQATLHGVKHVRELVVQAADGGWHVPVGLDVYADARAALVRTEASTACGQRVRVIGLERLDEAKGHDQWCTVCLRAVAQ